MEPIGSLLCTVGDLPCFWFISRFFKAQPPNRSEAFDGKRSGTTFRLRLSFCLLATPTNFSADGAIVIEHLVVKIGMSKYSSYPKNQLGPSQKEGFDSVFRVGFFWISSPHQF